jgi:DNA-binding protein H-NS
MSDVDNDNANPTSENEVVKTKPLFGGRQEERPLHNLGDNLKNDPEYREAAGLEPMPEETLNVIENEVDNIHMDQMTEAADDVANGATVEATVDGSQADLVAEVSNTLQEQIVGTQAAPETVLEAAPQAVSVEVAAAAAADNAAQTLAVTTATTDNGETIESLRAKQDELNRQINEKSTAERQAVINQIKSVVETYNIPVAELVEALGGLKSKRVGSKAAAKYRDPVTSKEWSGRGKEPLWIKNQDRTKFAITE